MKIVFNFRRGHAPLREALAEAGCEIIDNVWSLSPQDAAGVDGAIVSLYEAARRPLEALALKRRLARHRAPLVAFDRDAPWHMGMRRRRLLLFKLLKVADIYATHTLQPTYRFAPRTVYVANAVWVRNFNLHGHTLEEMREPGFYRYDVSFVGNMNGARYAEHAERQRFFAALAPELTRRSISHLFLDSTGVDEARQIEIIQRSRINLNFRSSCDHAPGGSWGLPERCYGVPARGGFLLSDPRRHARDDFDVDREWAEFDGSVADCVARIEHHLAHFDGTRRIAEAAHARVMAMHTYQHRARTLIDAIEAWRRDEPQR